MIKLHWLHTILLPLTIAYIYRMKSYPRKAKQLSLRQKNTNGACTREQGMKISHKRLSQGGMNPL